MDVETSKTIVVAMSGGVDSSVAAALLKDQGHNVIGITLQVWPEGAESDGQGCCSIDAVEDARRVANKLGIPHYVMNLREEFERSVIQDFIDEYAEGRTPNPCVRCNEHVKFRTLLDRAIALGADYLATGHYARVIEDSDGLFHLHRAENPAKDQSYVLYMLGQEELSRILFPLASLTKDETREIARRYDLNVWSKPDSQEVCFVTKGNVKDFLTERRPELARVGNIVNLEGKVVGEHTGTAGFTIGQRKGLGIAASEPLYVVDINAKTNEIIVGPLAALMVSSVIVGELQWVAQRPPATVMAVTCKVRYNMPTVPALFRLYEKASGPTDKRNGFGSGDLWELRFENPERAPTPGQAAVFFSGDEVIGGGTIEKVVRSTDYTIGAPLAEEMRA